MKRAMPLRALRRMTIENFGLIALAELEFADGLTVCSGETGSGKTMLLGALNFALGARACADVVRAGAVRARVTLEIEADAALHEAFAREGFELEAGEDAIFCRELSAAGKSAARINGRAATSAQLRALGELAVDFVGQHEQQRLLSPSYQLEILDRFAGARAHALRERVQASYRAARELAEDLERLQADASRLLADCENARDIVREVEEAAVRPGEKAELRERRAYLSNLERIAGALGSAYEAVSGEEGSAIERLGSAASGLAAVAPLSEDLAGLHALFAALQSDANEASAALTRELDGLEGDPQELEMIGARLDRIERLERKYGGSWEALLAEHARAEALLEGFGSRNERLASLQAELAQVRARLGEQAGELTALRTQAARRLEERVAEELRGLGMPAARFEVLLESASESGPTGAEQAAFLLAPNPGEPPRRLAKAASGGELSRMLLALIVAISEQREPATLVFDEIDAGIGGATAKAVGARLGLLACATQVLCVTHLAQLASWADAHYVLSKNASQAATRIELHRLAAGAPVREEIARMLSGTIAAPALEHAEALLREVEGNRGKGTRSQASQA